MGRAGGACAPAPSSRTSTPTSSPWYVSRTWARARPACLRVLVRASWTIRKTVRPTVGGSGRTGPSTVNSVSVPASRDSVMIRPRSSAPGCGAGGLCSGSSPARSTSRSWRISRSAIRPESSRVTSASRDTSGSYARLARAPPAISCMVVMWWATMSCSSRAIRRRSSATARSASRVRWASASRCRWLTTTAAVTVMRAATAFPARPHQP